MEIDKILYFNSDETIEVDNHTIIYDDILKNADKEEIVYDLIRLFLKTGKYYQGCHRIVILPNLFPDIVIKIDKGTNENIKQNLMEFQIYSALECYPKLRKFYCPIIGISKNHKLLVMKRVTRLLKEKDLDREDLKKLNVPASFLIDDPKFDNFGFIGKQLVCIDYGFLDTMMYIREKPIPWKDFAKRMVNNNDSNSKKSIKTLSNILDDLDKGKSWLED
jgi:hypothetical protein